MQCKYKSTCKQTGKKEYDASKLSDDNEQNIFQGLRADLDGYVELQTLPVGVDLEIVPVPRGYSSYASVLLLSRLAQHRIPRDMPLRKQLELVRQSL